MFRALRRSLFNTRTFGVEVYALYLAARDPRTPRYAQLLGLLVAAYAFSPIDLIPDFIPGLGLLDDLVIIPLGLKLVSGLIPADVRAETRARAAVSTIARPRFWRWVAIITIIVVLFWLLALGVMLWLVLRWLW